MSEPTKATADVRETFLTVLSAGGTPTQAAAATPVCRTHWYQIRNTDPEFAAAWDAAQQQGKEAYKLRLMDTFQTRALEGFTERKVIKDADGQVQREEVTTRAADRLLLREVERHDPAYQQHSNVRHSGEVEVSATVLHELSTPWHVLSTWENVLLYDPRYRDTAPTMLPAVRQALAALKAEEARAVEGESRPA